MANITKIFQILNNTIDYNFSLDNLYSVDSNTLENCDIIYAKYALVLPNDTYGILATIFSKKPSSNDYQFTDRVRHAFVIHGGILYHVMRHLEGKQWDRTQLLTAFSLCFK